MASPLDVAVLVGNPRPHSRTRSAAHAVASALADAEPAVVVDVCEFGGDVLVPNASPVQQALAKILACPVLVAASPTYKATYTGLLKCFLDQVPTGAMAGLVAVPLLVGGSPTHALAPELTLKPVFVELGATCPTRGLYLLESKIDAGEIVEQWIEPVREQVRAAASRKTPAPEVLAPGRSQP